MAIFNSYVSLPEGTNCFFPSTKLRIEPDEPENMGARGRISQLLGV